MVVIHFSCHPLLDLCLSTIAPSAVVPPEPIDHVGADKGAVRLRGDCAVGSNVVANGLALSDAGEGWTT